jgi:hypothetical protein
VGGVQAPSVEQLEEGGEVLKTMCVGGGVAQGFLEAAWLGKTHLWLPNPCS